MAATTAAVISSGAALYGATQGSKGSKTEVKNDPWGPLQPYLKDLFKKSQGLQEGFTKTHYPGQTFAPMDPLQRAAQRMALQYATGSSQLPQANMPQMPQSIPTMAPQGAFPLYQQQGQVPQGGPMNPAQPPTSGEGGYIPSNIPFGF